MNTYPTSEYDDLGKVILSLGIGEAIVTVMNERGAPTPVAWTRLPAPESLMGPADGSAMEQAVEGLAAVREVRRAGRPRVGPGEARRQARGGSGEGPRRAGGRRDGHDGGEAAPGGGARHAAGSGSRRKPREEKSAMEEVLTSTTARQLGRTAVREILRGMFKTGRR